MTLEEYERTQFVRYQALAIAVRTILDEAISASEAIPRPQSIQSRAKTPESLRKRLTETQQLEADVAAVRRDLAGVRLIFYTNNDVERFLNSSIVFDNFTVDRSATKIHHPAMENGEVRYQAVHYTVTLNEDRAKLPEYAAFAGMRCEIQIQTILIHAWAETSHDILYKKDEREGFGNAALEQIKRRFDRIIDKYLIPAGYEFQRAQTDYERLLAGKTLFDEDLLDSINGAVDNNERYELLTSLVDDVLPMYDDITTILPQVIESLVGAVAAARESPDKPLETPFGNYGGHTAPDIARKVTETLDAYRYTAPAGLIYVALETIFVSETDDGVRKSVREAVGHLAEYNLRAWDQVGTLPQDHLAQLLRSRAEIPAGARPLVVEVWKHLLDAEATGTTWGPDSVSLQSGEVPVDAVGALREFALNGLFNLFATAADEGERRDVFHALRNATGNGARNGLSAVFLKRSLVDQRRIIEFLTANVEAVPYELRETIEHAALYDYYWVSGPAGPQAEGVREEAVALKLSIIALRDRFDADETYVRYKTLVGFEGVVPPQWEDRSFDYPQIEAYRDRRLAEFVEEVADDTKEGWLELLKRASATKSNDLATFPKLGEFIVQLSRSKPQIADYLLANADEELLRFVPGFLNGLHGSGDDGTYRKNLTGLMGDPVRLASIAKHLVNVKPHDVEMLATVMDRSIQADSVIAVSTLVAFAVTGAPDAVPDKQRFLRPGLAHLIEKGDTTWAHWSWTPARPVFFDGLAAADVDLILSSLLQAPKVDYQVEAILSHLAVENPQRIWDFFGQRLRHPSDRDDAIRYEAIPYGFQLIGAPLSIHPALALTKTREWYGRDKSLFGYKGGRMISSLFTHFPQAFSDLLVDLVVGGTREDADFTLGILQNYHGEKATHSVLKALLVKFPGDADVADGVARSIRNTGVVRGEYGFVENLREKKAMIEGWLEDASQPVVAFARDFIAAVDRSILEEKRRADASVALRKLDYDDPE